MFKKQFELKTIYIVLSCMFLVFLCMPVVLLLVKSLQSGNGLSLSHFQTMFGSSTFLQAFQNSFQVSSISALCATTLAFLLAYTINYTNIPAWLKKTITAMATLPMLLPTITYGFAILYSFGKQGLLTTLWNLQSFDIYGFRGLFIGYVIYTLPIAFLLINTTMKYIDKKYIIVSKIMKDSSCKRFFITILSPLITTLAAAFIQAFFLSFTDFGIPAAVGGEFPVIATTLYNEMLGAIPNFNNGAVVATMMLLPSIISVFVLHYLDRFNVRYQKVSMIELPTNRKRDVICGCISTLTILSIVAVFAVIFLLPFIKEWPYDISFSLTHLSDTLSSSNLIGIFKNTLLIALFSAVFGTAIAFLGAIITTRSHLPNVCKRSIEIFSNITNTIPGMVIGIAFLLMFQSTSLQGTFFIIIMCNILHFFTTPYTMMKQTLAKMNASFETTAILMKDTWWKTIRRIIIPYTKDTIWEMLSYYFINSMVTISAIIFLVGAKTNVLTTKIKEMQHFAKFNEIFVLSLLILLTNVAVKVLIHKLSKEKKKERSKHQRLMKSLILGGCSCLLAFTMVFGNAKENIVIYSNADEEALIAMRQALDAHGYKDQYMLQSFGTSELGGKLIAEKTSIEADIITMSSYYLESAQEESRMFEELTFPVPSLTPYLPFYAPITSQEGALFMNTEVIKKKNLPLPNSFKDLTNPIYRGNIAIPNIKASSTGWLLVQAVLHTYGNTEGKEVLRKIIENVGPHLENSGSGPLKKIQSGEVAIAFGLRHQGLASKQRGLPIEVIDPTEGNYHLTESIAVVKKDQEQGLAMEMANCIITYARKEIQQTYPNALYRGEQTDDTIASKYPRIYPQTLNVALLKQHQAFFESAIK